MDPDDEESDFDEDEAAEGGVAAEEEQGGACVWASSSSDADNSIESAGDWGESEGHVAKAGVQGPGGSAGSQPEGSEDEGGGGKSLPLADPGGQLLAGQASTDQTAAGSPLAALARTLRHLSIRGASCLPRGLAALTGLQALDLRAVVEWPPRPWAVDDLEGLQEVLSGMTGLTSLILDGVPPVGRGLLGAALATVCPADCPCWLDCLVGKR